ncbi:RICIN domain-containing protein [Catenulispora sp. NF23]|uniref:glycosyl hydrolase family 18 protein n=1 Tax=Catenulispora pinistramenti TaxID=2705254 RepID=UPI001BAD1250|nr:glycosyl hydrolase family 18 protein [Catenulispora pinistramenti]MBS2537185.1 RICIN domain-containing protein [Catenulispora pinistramenti]
MFVSMRRRRGRPGILLLVGAMVASVLTAVGAAPAHALVQDRPAWTWNMQGATADGQNKWTTVVGPILNPNQGGGQPPVVALQEVGSGPPTAAPGTVNVQISGNQLTPLPAGIFYDVPNNPAARTVVHSQWRSGGVNHDVYYLQTDANNGAWTGGRVNLAIVTPGAANGVVIIPTPGGINSGGALRPALGVLIGNTWYFSVHAQSGGGTNAPGLLANINAFVAARNASNPNGEEGLVLGDFNREPGTLPAVATQQIIAPNMPTQRQGSVLDYGVIVDPDHIFPAGLAATLPIATQASDHQPVRIQLTSTPTQSPSAVPLYPTARVIENVQAGGVVDAFNQGTANGTLIDSFARNGQSNQAWTVLGYPDGSLQFQGVGSSRCIDITNSTSSPGSGRALSLFDCTSQFSQRWLPVYQGNGEFQFQSVLVPSLCMNVSGGQSVPTTASGLILFACANVPNERFFFGPATPATATDPNVDPVSYLQSVGQFTMENLFNGGVMDVQGNATANNTLVDSYSRNGLANQAWTAIPNSTNGTVSLKSVSSGRCVDIHNSTAATLGSELVIFDCSGQASQQFFPIALSDGQWEFQSASTLPAVSGACLVTANATSGNPRSGNESVNTCNNAGRQTFTLTPYDPTGTPTRPTDPDFTSSQELITVPNAAVPAQRVGYYTSWSTYANAFYPKNLDTEGIAGKLTVLNYAFENIDPVNLTCLEANKASSSVETDPTGNDGSSDAFADYQKEYTAATSVDGTADTFSQPLRGNFNQLKELKAKYPNLKILLTIGGWTYSKYFSDVAATDASRKKFVASCINMYIKGNLPTGISNDPAGGVGDAAGIFSGFDIDWEFPGSDNGHVGNHVSAQDGANYTALLNEFRTELNALGGQHYLLDAALPAGPTEIANLNIPSLAGALDLGDVMAYDFHGAFETTGPTNFQSPLYDAPESPAFGTKFTADDSVSAYISGGFPSTKLTLGVPFYGRGWTGVPAGGQNGLYQSVTGPTASFPLSVTPGVADYKELESAGKLTSSNLFYDSASESTWVYDGTNFWSIETPLTLALKRQYIQQMNLGGIMMYSLEADDPTTTLTDAATGMN